MCVIVVAPACIFVFCCFGTTLGSFCVVLLDVFIKSFLMKRGEPSGSPFSLKKKVISPLASVTGDQ